MIFEYDELKEYVTENFERFYKMGFNEEQILPAVMDEYEHGEDFCEVEKICIHLFLALSYAERKWNYDEITEKLEILLKGKIASEVRTDLGNEYTKFYTDFKALIKNNEHNGRGKTVLIVSRGNVVYRGMYTNRSYRQYTF